MALAVRCVHPSSRQGSLPGSCKAAAMDGQIKEASAKTKPRFSPFVGEEIKLETSVVNRLERIFREGTFGGNNNNNVLFPMKPQPPWRFYEGRPVKVAYQGVRGSYCQEAAVRAFQRCDALPFEEGMESAFEAVESGAVDRAVVPVENSLDGVIDRNYDLLLRHPGLHIVGEVLLPVNHCLLGVTGINGVRRIVSHPQALSHCERRLEALSVQVEAVDNAAAAAQFVAENGVTDTAVIGSRIAGREFGLRVLEPAMQDEDLNVTRFFVLGKQCAVPSAGRPSKTTVAFSLETADLFKALCIFDMSNIKVTKIESRPRKENPKRENVGNLKYFEYIFVVDVEASVADPAMERALILLQQIASPVRVLGSYLIDL